MNSILLDLHPHPRPIYAREHVHQGLMNMICLMNMISVIFELALQGRHSWAAWWLQTIQPFAGYDTVALACQTAPLDACSMLFGLCLHGRAPRTLFQLEYSRHFLFSSFFPFLFSFPPTLFFFKRKGRLWTRRDLNSGPLPLWSPSHCSGLCQGSALPN